jgi:hypothetical protein
MKIEIKEYNFDGYTIKKSKTYDQRADADVITYELKNIPAYKAKYILREAPIVNRIY